MRVIRNCVHCRNLQSVAQCADRAVLAPLPSFPSGLGVYYGVREACRNPDVLAQTGLTEGLKDKRIVVQGFGNGA